jgi:hypothetical protein
LSLPDMRSMAAHRPSINANTAAFNGAAQASESALTPVSAEMNWP